MLGIKEKSGGTGDENRKFWCPLFEKYGVDAVLEHHDHTFKRTHPLTDGHVDNRGAVPGSRLVGSVRRRHGQAAGSSAKVSGSYHMTVHKLEGEQRYHVALEETGRIADIFGTFGKRQSGVRRQVVVSETCTGGVCLPVLRFGIQQGCTLPME